MKTKFASARNLTIWYLENLRLEKALEWTSARDSAVISIGSTHSTAAHENQKEPYLSVGTSFISAAHENQKEPHPSVGTSSISVPYSNTCSTTEKGIGNKSLDLLPAPHRSPIPIGGVHSTQGADDIYINKYFMNKAELMQKMRT
ncbi:predicted protein [Arabidopsis lyrata subsp. lyrata]|uniref:Predicted protein n=1 Tax=Arabidopsis lyrata subsp. lyrata TaxID=81972 RepID=D7LL61_ARALL|nr:predicted protein [Arabidopsis lyrata subsp. lyrata]